MMEAASFPHLGRVVNPTREHYETEAALWRAIANSVRYRMAGRHHMQVESELKLPETMARKFDVVARRLAWVPAAIQQMKDAA